MAHIEITDTRTGDIIDRIELNTLDRAKAERAEDRVAASSDSEHYASRLVLAPGEQWQ